MTLLLAIDPGKATGVSLWNYEPDAPFERINYWLVQNGSKGFRDWFREADFGVAVIVCESFKPDGRTKAPDLNPVRVETVLEVLWGDDVIFQPNTMKTNVPDALLKKHGLWVTGADVDWVDGRDVNDSQIHALAYAKSIHHVPTIRKYWPDE
jgi:hypothetical protein